MYDAQGSTIYRAYTDENGQLPDIPLVPGSYTFKETYAPEGYALNVAVKTFTVTSEGKIIGETEIRDEINKIQLKKVKENGEPLPGAVFGYLRCQQHARAAADFRCQRSSDLLETGVRHLYHPGNSSALRLSSVHRRMAGDD